MGEVIKVDFGNNKEKRPTEQEQDVLEQKIGSENNTVRFLGLMDKINKIDSLPSSRTASANSQELVKGYRDDELFDWIENNFDSDFAKKPAFFQNIVAELRRRIRM